MGKQSTSISQNLAHCKTPSERILDALQKRGMSKMQLAAKAGVSYRQAINILSHGHKPQIETARRFGDVLDCSPDWLLFGKSSPAPEPHMVREERLEWAGKKIGDERFPQTVLQAIATLSAQTGLTKAEVLETYCELLKRKVREESNAKGKTG